MSAHQCIDWERTQDAILDSSLPEIEQEFRRSWRDFDPARYPEYLDRVSGAQRLEMLTRILSAELEYSFQPPATDATERLLSSEEDERVRPCVRLFLVRFPELAGDSNLMIRLVVLEYALRLQYDRLPPDPESYLALCADSGDRLIRLLELTESRMPGPRNESDSAAAVSHSDSTVRETQLSRSISIDPLPLNLGCYLLMRLIGKGGMGYVHAAIDLRSTAQVAVKVMRRDDAWSVYRFIEEFRWLSQLEHPNLVKLYNANSEGDLRYFSMELVEGNTIREWFKRLPNDAPTRWQQLRKVLGQLASAIHYLHENHVIHCDIKCSNMMITHRRRAVVLDLGLAVHSGEANPLVGTIQYMAPEVVSGGVPTRSSDWYSFGVMMYEVLTDRYPPIGVNPSREAAAYTMATDELTSSLSTCPEDLASICTALLSSAPQERLDGKVVVERLGGRERPLPKAGATILCAGRKPELGQLQRALASIEDAGRACVVVQGEAGIGKSSLVRHWLAQVDRTRYRALLLRCYHQDHTPHRVLNSLIQELVLSLRDTPPGTWRSSLEKHVDRISLVFPQVSHLAAETTPGILPLRERIDRPAPREECLQALVAWLVDISQSQPLLIVVDDAQWSDQESCRVLAMLLRQAAFRGLVVLVEDSGNQVAQQMLSLIEPTAHAVHRIELQPLTEHSCIELLKQWASDSATSMPTSVAVRLARTAGGNPFLLREVARSCMDGGGPELLGPTADAQLNVSRRFASLPRDAEIVLQYLAVANQAFGFHQLQMVSRIMPHDLQRALSLLSSQGWIRPQREEPVSDVEIAHENFRRAIMQGLPEDRLERRHCRIARILSSESPPPWPRIAGHYWSARRYREAATCYLEAARVAIAAGACNEAGLFLERASHPSADRSPTEKLNLLRLKANCLAALGSSRAAAEIYESLFAQSEGRDRLWLQCLAGEQWIRAGQLEPGLRLLRSALQRDGIANWKRGSFAQWRLRRQAIAVALKKPPQQLDLSPQREPFDDIQRCLSRLTTPLTFLENMLGPQLILQLDRLSGRRGTLSDCAQATLRTAIVLSFAGRRFRRVAVERLRLGRNLARNCGSDSTRAVAHFCMFVWYAQQGLQYKAIRHGKKSLQLFAESSDHSQWEQQFLKWGILGCYWNTMQLRALRESTDQLRESAMRRDDPMSVFWNHVAAAHWSELACDRARGGREFLSIAEQAIANQSFQSPRFFLWMSRVDQCLYEDDAQAAQQVLWQDWRQLTRSLLLSTNHYRWLALCARARCDLLSARFDPARRAHWLADARRTAARMRKLEEPAFVAYHRVFSLAIDAAAGVASPLSTWDATIEQLHRLDQHLIANALHWHSSLVAPPEEANRRTQAAERALAAEGCVRPAQLLNVILPLPRVDC